VKNEIDDCLARDSSSSNSGTESLSTVSESESTPLERELSRAYHECAQLNQQLQRERKERIALANRYFELQKRCTTLTRVQVAAERLLTPQARADVYTAIMEVVANLVGSEQVGVFLFDQKDCSLHLVASCGIDSGRFSIVPLGSSMIGRSAATGDIFVARGPKPTVWSLSQEETLSACIPLRRDGLLLGAVAIFELLDHRPEFDAEDVELFEAIAKWASLAVYCTAIGWLTTGKGNV
jgi:hypothetical protein